MPADLPTKIVGVQYYRGFATLGEHVAVKREPQNPYDSNAIRVLNVMGQQIGHIPRTVAAKLAKYMVKPPIYGTWVYSLSEYRMKKL